MKTETARSFENLFNQLNKESVNYVIPREYEKVPDGLTTSKDLDIFIQGDDFERGCSVIKNTSFAETHSQKLLPHYLFLARKALNNPGKALRFLSKPKLAKQVVNPLNTGGQTIRKFRTGGITLDVRTPLAYKSPMNDQWIRVDPYVEEKFFERREKFNDVYKPSSPDELAHIIPRYIFDKKGNFPDYYKNRANKVFEKISGSKKKNRQFKKLLTKIFFKASDLVYNLIEQKRYDDILDELYRFSDY